MTQYSYINLLHLYTVFVKLFQYNGITLNISDVFPNLFVYLLKIYINLFANQKPNYKSSDTCNNGALKEDVQQLYLFTFLPIPKYKGNDQILITLLDIWFA